MKKLLIVNNNMHLGGVQKSLLNLLYESSVAEDFSVTLLLFYDGGEYRKSIPKQVKVISACTPLNFWGMTRDDTTTLSLWAGRAFWAGVTRLLGRGFAFSLIRLFQKKLSGYDVAISYLHSGSPKHFYGGCNEFVLECVEAKKKISFLHCDYGKIHADCSYNTKLYSRFDVIAACSGGCRDAFLQVLPQFTNKTVSVPNCHRYAMIRSAAAEAKIILDATKMNIVSVSRLGKEKGIDRAVRALSKLKNRITGIHYFIIGSGSEKETILNQIEMLGLQDSITLMGEMDNPYGLMKAADLLLIPSYSEAAPMVIGESACLATPILSTETSSAFEMITKTGYGWVCKNSEEGIQKAILYLLDHPEEIKRKKQKLKQVSFSNLDAVSCLARLLRDDTETEKLS